MTDYQRPLSHYRGRNVFVVLELDKTRENPFAEPDLPSRRFPPAILHVGIYEIGRLVTIWLLLDSSLLCAPSIISQALRAAMVAAELPLRGKLRAEATTFSPTHSSFKCLYECLHALLYRD